MNEDLFDPYKCNFLKFSEKNVFQCELDKGHDSQWHICGHPDDGPYSMWIAQGDSIRGYTEQLRHYDWDQLFFGAPGIEYVR